jgi:hypothetical protein
LKVVAALLLAAAGAGTLIGVYALGVAVGLRRSYTAKLRKMGITPRTVGMYRDAARLLYRLDGTSDVAGIAAGDALSPETRDQVTAWVTRHRKEIDCS